jgi:hypothetical protein
MPDLSRFRALSTVEKALVAIAVLFDGHDAVEYLSSDRERHIALTRAAKDLVELSPELRLPLVGTLLREAAQEIVGNEQS